MDIQQNLELFRELMLCDGDIYSWTYDASGTLLQSNCPDASVLSTAFEVFGCLSKMLELGSERDMPTFLSSDTGLVWGAAYEKVEGILYRCYVIGPVFYSNISAEYIYRGLMHKDYSSFSRAWILSLKDALCRVPTSQHTIFSRNLKMLHYCVTGHRIRISDVYVDDIQMLPDAKLHTLKDRHRVYNAEKQMLEMVRLGDLNYRDALSDSMRLSNGVTVHSRDPIRANTVSTVVFCSIVCRAAIEGGLSPEEAYSLGDAYIQSALDARTLDEFSTICISMYDDFIHRVHRIRSAPRYSQPIRRCCNYIEMNLNRNIRAKELADLVGYSVTYLTRRFREETGIGISDYVKAVRIERGRVLLQTTDLSVQEISDRLGFSTRNYFSYCFKEVTGETPVSFRNHLAESSRRG